MSIDSVSKEIVESLFQPLVQCEREKEHVLDKIKCNAAQYGKFTVLVQQANFIKRQLQELVNESMLNINLHNVKCGFTKKSGNTYYLYNPEDPFFSLLSLKDWNNNPPYHYIGAYYFDYDKSFKPVEI